MPRVCVIGSANVDYTLAVARLPRPGETVSGGTLMVDMGGKGANQAVAARRLGAEVQLIGCVGDDAAGRDVRARLGAQGLDVNGLVTTQEAATGAALITVDAEGRNQIAVAPGANHRMTVAMAEPWAGAIHETDVVVCQLETPVPVVAWALGEARRHRVTTVLNPAPAQKLDDDLLRLVDYLVPNESEAELLTGVAVADPETAREAATRLRERGVGTVIVTLGEQGALVLGADAALHFPAFPVQAVDTTAAGDAFIGAFAVGLAARGTLEQAIPLASAAAALTCTKRGAQSSLPDRAAVEAFLRRLRDGASD